MDLETLRAAEEAVDQLPLDTEAGRQAAHEAITAYADALAAELGLVRDEATGQILDDEGRALNVAMLEARLVRTSPSDG